MEEDVVVVGERVLSALAHPGRSEPEAIGRMVLLAKEGAVHHRGTCPSGCEDYSRYEDIIRLAAATYNLD